MTKHLTFMPSRRALLAAAVSAPARKSPTYVPEKFSRDANWSKFPASDLHLSEVALKTTEQHQLNSLLRGRAWTKYAHPGLVHAVTYPLVQLLLLQPTSPVNPLSMRQVSHQVLVNEPLPLDARVEVLVSGSRLGIGHARVVRTIHYEGRVAQSSVSDFLSPGISADVSPVQLSAEAAQVRWRIEGNLGKKFAQLSRDISPQHVAAVGGQLLGHEKAVVPGMYLAARALSQMVHDIERPYAWTVFFDEVVTVPTQLLVNFDAVGERYRYSCGAFSGALEYLPEPGAN